MALTHSVSKVWPQAKNRNMFAVGVNMVLKDDAVTVRDVTFTEEVAKNADPTPVTDSLTVKCQEVIDAYRDEKLINGHAKYNALVTNVSDGLVLE